MNEQDYMIECMAKDLVLLLMERRNLDIETALAYTVYFRHVC